MTLTTERLKWLHDAATELSATKLKMTMRPDELLILTSELLANREAQPVALDVIARFKEWNTGFPVEKFKADYVIGWVLANYYAPPAPAVNAAPDFEAWFVEKYKQPERLMKNEDGAYKFSGVQMAFSAWSDGRAAMLAQPLSSGYKLPDNVREALTLALQAMEFMGDTLNNIDAVCAEDVEYVAPAFNAVRELLAAVPEGGN